MEKELTRFRKCFPIRQNVKTSATNLRFIPKDGPAPHFPDHPRGNKYYPVLPAKFTIASKGVGKGRAHLWEEAHEWPFAALGRNKSRDVTRKGARCREIYDAEEGGAFLSLTNPGYSDEKRNGSYCKLYPGMEKIGRAVGAFTTNLGQSLSFRNSFSPRDSPRKSGVEDRGLSGLDRRQREKGFFFSRNLRNPMGQVYTRDTHTWIPAGTDSFTLLRAQFPFRMK